MHKYISYNLFQFTSKWKKFIPEFGMSVGRNRLTEVTLKIILSVTLIQ